MARFVERDKYDWWSQTWKLLIFVAIVIFALVVIYPWRGFLPTILLIVAGLWMYISLVSRKSGYLCEKCGKPFQVPTTVNFFTTSSIGKNPDGTYYSYKTPHLPQLRQAHQGAHREARGRARGAGERQAAQVARRAGALRRRAPSCAAASQPRRKCSTTAGSSAGDASTTLEVGQALHEVPPVALLAQAVVQDHDHAVVGLGADQAPEPLPELEHGLRQVEGVEPALPRTPRRRACAPGTAGPGGGTAAWRSRGR